MNSQKIWEKELAGFQHQLRVEEHSAGTIEKYRRDVARFLHWLGEAELTGEATARWKEHLAAQYAPTTVNAMLAALNAFLRCIDREDCRLRFLKIQRRLFRDASRELTRDEYRRLIATAQRQGQDRLALILETIGSTGIRVSEVAYITLEAAQIGRAEISLKGKIRTIFAG